ncbi:MAG: hypothetical protein PHF31_12035 [Methylobacter sp.]|nr:hypothetical protein [Methylobacter sp.]
MDANHSPLLSSIHYQPFGPAQDWIFGNGVKTNRSFDLDGRLIGYDLGDRTRQLTYDAAGRITDYLDSDLNYDQSFSYDPLDRLTDYSDPATQTSYNYDANGNRTQQQEGAQNKNFNIEASSNRLLAITDANLQTLKNYSYDASGHLTSDGYNQFTYDGRGRLVQVANISLGVEQYRINGLGQRVAKIHGQASEQSKEDDHDGRRTETDRHRNPGKGEQDKHDKDMPAGIYFVYDEAGHLLGEYNQRGKPIQETVWLGNIPAAVLAGDKHYFVYADHLNSPRAITDSIGKVVWRWDSDPFGATAQNEDHYDRQALGTQKADEDPDHDGHEFVYNLRFPGQYYDKETGLYYNGLRDYDSSIGRYIQSDPIGLRGGINTYNYVNINPVNLIDPTGEIGQQQIVQCIKNLRACGVAFKKVWDGCKWVWKQVREGADDAPDSNIPSKANDTLEQIKKTGNAPPGYKGGRTFNNDSRGGGQQLPQEDLSGSPITYKEYDVNPYQQGVNQV